MFSRSSMSSFKPCRGSFLNQLLKGLKIDYARAKVNYGPHTVKLQDFWCAHFIFSTFSRQSSVLHGKGSIVYCPDLGVPSINAPDPRLSHEGPQYTPVKHAHEIEQSQQRPELDLYLSSFAGFFGYVRCYGRNITKTSLKRKAEINALKQAHSEEVSTLRDEFQDKIDRLQNAFKTVIQQGNPQINIESIEDLLGLSHGDANSSPKDIRPQMHSSTSTHAPCHGKQCINEDVEKDDINDEIQEDDINDKIQEDDVNDKIQEDDVDDEFQEDDIDLDDEFQEDDIDGEFQEDDVDEEFMEDDISNEFQEDNLDDLLLEDKLE
ncbi:unnamed protein product [Vicia faba]|uniref:Uncharacterized protein n=1 Tax=Vicia faba TaxID=3906 RepID=A0AAV0ZUP8_VICFA|nr:unnamed protein product [Vicia faba]